MIILEGTSFADIARRTPMAKQIRPGTKAGEYRVILWNELKPVMPDEAPPGVKETIDFMRDSVICTPFNIRQVAAHLF